MKKINFLLATILVLTTILGSAIVSAEKFSLTELDKEKLAGFGFSVEEIANFDANQWATFKAKNDGENSSASVVSKKTTYFKINDGVTEVVTKEEAIAGAEETKKARKDLEEKKQNKGIVTTLALPSPNTATTSWMSMTLSVSQISGGTYNGMYTLKNSFNWLIVPTYKLTDLTGITWNPNLTYQTNSDYGNYAAVGAGNSNITTNYPLSAYAKDVQGIGFKVDLKAYTPNGNYSIAGNNGYVAAILSKNSSSAISTNGYGHYAHLYNTFNFSLNLANGAFSVTGTTGKDYMNDTGLSWNF